MNPPDPTRPTSVRIGVARLAEQVIAADPGVGPVQHGGRWLTRDGDRVIPGVVVAAAGAAQVDVSLHLDAFLPPRPLEQQAAELRTALLGAARRAGLADSIGEIDVTIHDLVAPEEIPGPGERGAGTRI